MSGEEQNPFRFWQVEHSPASPLDCIPLAVQDGTERAVAAWRDNLLSSEIGSRLVWESREKIAKIGTPENAGFEMEKDGLGQAKT
jgi:hypothetical protein